MAIGFLSYFVCWDITVLWFCFSLSHLLYSTIWTYWDILRHILMIRWMIYMDHFDRHRELIFWWKILIPAENGMCWYVFLPEIFMEYIDGRRTIWWNNCILIWFVEMMNCWWKIDDIFSLNSLDLIGSLRFCNQDFEFLQVGVKNDFGWNDASFILIHRNSVPLLIPKTMFDFGMAQLVQPSREILDWVFHKWGYSKWLVYHGKAIYKWMMTEWLGGSPMT